jgi:hypothetical protein
VLAILVIAGLAVAPRSVLGVADAMSAGSMVASMSALADEMPCCPQKAPAPTDCQKCALMAACMSNCLANVSASTVALQWFPKLAQIDWIEDDSLRPGLIHPPPAKPPRMLVVAA